MSFAEFNNGPSVDYNGKPSASGQSLFKWFFPYGMDWRKACFIGFNKDLVEWEMEKMFKEKIFKMDFFPRAYAGEDYAINYLFLHPETAKKMLPLIDWYQKTGNISYGYMSQDKLLYILIKSDDHLREQFARRHLQKDTDNLIKKYDEIYAREKPLPAEELAKKNYDKYLNNYKSRKGFNLKDWLENWDIEKITWDILKQKAVTEKNTVFFVQQILKRQDTIPDSLAEGIIRYFKLDTSSPQINQSFLELLGKNPKLTQAILKHFDAIKKPQNPDNYYKAAALILKKNVHNVTPGLWCKYAAITGDYNGTFKKIVEKARLDSIAKAKQRWDILLIQDKDTIKRLASSSPKGKELMAAVEKSLKKPGWYPPSVLNPKTDLTDYSGLLLKGSKLSEQNARYILENSQTLSSYQVEMEPKFAKLLPEKYFIAVNTVSLPFAASFPFESLTPEGQKTLFAAYAEVMKKKGYLTQKTAVVKELSKLESPVYRNKTIKLLMENESRPGDEALQALTLEWLPELLTVAAGKDPSLAMKACELIGKTSLLGRAAAPKLRELLDAKNNFTVKIAAICALAEIGDKDSIPIIKKFFDDKNRLLARAAKQAVYLLQPFDEKDKLFEEMLKKKPKERRW
jgi:hypothetical protein